MISPQEIKKKATSKFKVFLSGIITQTSLFPLEIRGNKKPSTNISTFQSEILSLIEFSKDKKGYGYHIEFRKVKTRARNEQDLPSSISFNTEKDFLKFIGKENEVASFKKDVKLILNTYPELKSYLINKPLTVVKQAGKWDSIIRVLDYFRLNPKPNLYIRELPIKQIHTKFIEKNKGLLRELLNLILKVKDSSVSDRFEKRFGLKYAQPMIRFKILDKNLSNKFFSGLDDLALPLNTFKELNLNVSRIVILENKVSLYNALTIPNKENSIAVFGQGYSISNLQGIDWFNNAQIIYWGDFDTHGFHILSEIRGFYSHVQSILMDRMTFDQFYEGQEGKYLSKEILPNLTEDEQNLFEHLREHNYRLEQEKIPRTHFIEAFNKI